MRGGGFSRVHGVLGEVQLALGGGDEVQHLTAGSLVAHLPTHTSTQHVKKGKKEDKVGHILE